MSCFANVASSKDNRDEYLIKSYKIKVDMANIAFFKE